MSRRSRRFQKKQEEYSPKPLLDLYINQIGVRTTFADYRSFEASSDKELRKLHGQGDDPYCALYSIVTAVEIAQKRAWNKEERASRKSFCLATGRKGGDHLENTLKYYNETFPFDMTYKSAFNKIGANVTTGVEKEYANANDLIRGLQESVCVVTLSCADVDSRYRIHEMKKCSQSDWHCITCVAYILLKGEPTFVFKDTNNRPGNKVNFVYLKATQLTDAQLMLKKEIGDNPWGGVEASEKVRKTMSENNLLYMSEIYIIKSAIVGKLKNILAEDTDQAVEDIKKLLATPYNPKKLKKPTHPKKPKRKPRGISVGDTVEMWHDKTMDWVKAKITGEQLETVGEMEFPIYELNEGRYSGVSIDEIRIPNKKTRIHAYVYDIYDTMQEFSKFIIDTKPKRDEQIKKMNNARVEDYVKATVCVESNGSGCMIKGPFVLTCGHCNMTDRESQMENDEFLNMIKEHGSYKEYNKFAVGRLKGIAWPDGSWGVAETVYNSEGMDIALMKLVREKDVSTLNVSKMKPDIGDSLLMIHNPYRYDPDNEYKEIKDNYPFRVDADEITEMSTGKCAENTFGAYTHDEDHNSFFGSSGSPIVNANGEVVALHNATDPNSDWKRFAVGWEAIGQALNEYFHSAEAVECNLQNEDAWVCNLKF